MIVALDWGWGGPGRKRATRRSPRPASRVFRPGSVPLRPAACPGRHLVPAGAYGRRSVSIPYGETRSYPRSPAIAGGSARSAGQASGANPVPDPHSLPPRPGQRGVGRLLRGRWARDEARAARPRDLHRSTLIDRPAAPLGTGQLVRGRENIMTKAIRIRAYGGPEAMQWEDVPTPSPVPAKPWSTMKPSASTISTSTSARVSTRRPACPPSIGMEARRRRHRGRPGRHRGRGGRPRRLRRRPSAPTPGPGDDGRPAGEAPGRDRLSRPPPP